MYPEIPNAMDVCKSSNEYNKIVLEDIIFNTIYIINESKNSGKYLCLINDELGKRIYDQNVAFLDKYLCLLEEHGYKIECDANSQSLIIVWEHYLQEGLYEMSKND